MTEQALELPPRWLHWLRVFARGLCFATFGIGGLLLALTLLPAAHIWPAGKAIRDARARRVIHHSFRLFLRLMHSVGSINVDIEGSEKLRQASGKIVIANHPSLIDVIILVSFLPNYCCIVKQELWSNPWLAGVVRWTGYISNADSSSLLRQCEEILANGGCLVVFPEGTRTTDAKKLKFNRGAANIAVRCGVDVLPVTIKVTPPTLRRGEPWYQIPPVCPQWDVEVLAPIEIEPIVANIKEPAIATRKLNDHLLNFYQGLINHA